eukprot:s5106_g1.t1
MCLVRLPASAPVSTALKDIEEIVQSCKEANVCPYFKVREDAKEAELLLLPYDYLLGTQTREALQVPLKNSILIFDEGHNIERSCEEIASFELSQADIAGAISEIDDAFDLVERGEVDDEVLKDVPCETFLKHLNLFKKHLFGLEDSISSEKLEQDAAADRSIFKARGGHILDLLLRQSERGFGTDKEDLKHITHVIRSATDVLTRGQETANSGPLPPIGTAGDLEAASSTDGIGDMLPQAEEPISFHQAMEEANRRWIHVSDLDKIEGKMSITNMCGRGVGQQRMDECFAGKWRPAWFVSYIAEKNLRDLARQQGTCHAVAHQLLQRPALGRLSKHWTTSPSCTKETEWREEGENGMMLQDVELLERVTQLQAEVRQRALRERRSGRLETRKGVQCAQCGSAGEPTSLDLDDDFSALDALALTPWTRSYSCKRETISPCVCCRQPVAFDATLCFSCGTTTPHGSGGALLSFGGRPELWRCSCCGHLLASNASLCLSCGAVPGESLLGFRRCGSTAQQPCIACGRDIAVSAAFCIHCGHAVPKEAEPGPELARAPAAPVAGGLYLDKIQMLLSTAFKCDREELDNNYQLLITEEPKKGTKRKAVDFFTTDGCAAPDAPTPRTLYLWCFSCSVAMRDLQKREVYSVIITSGTLSPLQSTADAFGVPFPVMLENRHVIDASKQLMAAVVGRGPQQGSLDATFSNRSELAYAKELGGTVKRLAANTPDGLLLAFSSYGMKESIFETWKRLGMLTEIACEKPIFEEPKGNNETKKVMQEYSAALARGGNGAILAAVCRGKLCEGIDFTDKQCRTVVMVGIPYPARNELRVMLKQDFLDAKGVRGDGQRWYHREAIRAVNQTIGRAIRHRTDYGAVLLCDSRYASGSRLSNQASGLSSWLRPQVAVMSLEEAVKACQRFFGYAPTLGDQKAGTRP